MLTGTTGYVGLFAASFLSATLLPGGSEVLLAAMVHDAPGQLWAIVSVATLGNTLGALTSYFIGRLLPKARQRLSALEWLRRYGHFALLLSWLPIIGDALCVAAGWLKMNPWWSLLNIAVGKLARYIAVAYAVKAAMGSGLAFCL